MNFELNLAVIPQPVIEDFRQEIIVLKYALPDPGSAASVTVKNIPPPPQNYTPVCFGIQSYAKLYPSY